MKCLLLAQTHSKKGYLMQLTHNQLNTLTQCALFKNIALDELKSLLPCLKPIVQTYSEGTLIFTQATIIQYIYVILEGKVEIAKENFAGQKNIVSLLAAGKLFGEGVVCTSHRMTPVSALAHTDTRLLLIPYERIIVNCEHNCTFHHSIVYNMMRLLGEKNYHLNIKMDLLLLKGMREKLATYLLAEAHSCQNASFTVPLNRNQLADYLNVSRPSMCRELGRMKDEGLIDYYQNSFKLLDMKRLQDVLLYEKA